jgi:hypothetical protein
LIHARPTQSNSFATSPDFFAVITTGFTLTIKDRPNSRVRLGEGNKMEPHRSIGMLAMVALVAQPFAALADGTWPGSNIPLSHPVARAICPDNSEGYVDISKEPYASQGFAAQIGRNGETLMVGNAAAYSPACENWMHTASGMAKFENPAQRCKALTSYGQKFLVDSFIKSSPIGVNIVPMFCGHLVDPGIPMTAAPSCFEDKEVHFQSPCTISDLKEVAQ